MSDDNWVTRGWDAIDEGEAAGQGRSPHVRRLDPRRGRCDTLSMEWSPRRRSRSRRG